MKDAMQTTSFAAYLKEKGGTDDQLRAAAEIDAFLEDPTHPCFILKGYAGTGKTYVMGHLVAYLHQQKKNCVLLAPTGRAAKVFEKKAGHEATTIHSHIYEREIEEEDISTKEEKRKVLKRFRFRLSFNEDATDTIYIVDEASMVSDHPTEDEILKFGSGRLLTDFFTFLDLSDDKAHPARKVIFVGDPAQLPPVGSTFSPALNRDYLHKKHRVAAREYELRDIVRQEASSGILNNAMAIRGTIEGGYYNQLVIDASTDDVIDLPDKDIEATYMEVTDGKVDEDTIIIAYTNASVSAYNRMVRRRLFPHHPTPAAGDRLLVIQNHGLSGLMNGDFVRVHRVADATERREVTFWQRRRGERKAQKEKVTLSFRDVEVLLPGPSTIPLSLERAYRRREIDQLPIEITETGEGHPLMKCKILENALYNDKRHITPTEARALYEFFKQRHASLHPGTGEFFLALSADPYFNALQVKFGYAVTGHKAQGGEWKNVFIDFQPAGSYWNETYFRWAYTVVSRARERLYCIHRPDMPLIKGIEVVVPEPIPAHPETAAPPAAPAAVEALPDGLQMEGGSTVIVAPPQSEDEQPPTSHPTARAIWLGAGRVLIANGLQIDNTIIRDWMVRLEITDGEKTGAINIYYNSKGKVSSLTTQPPSELGARVKNLLSFLKKKKVVIGEPSDAAQGAMPEISFPPELPYLRQFYEQAREAVALYHILIANVEHHNYLERYFFRRGSEEAVIDFYHNRRGRFTRATVHSHRTNSLRLMKDVFSAMELKVRPQSLRNKS